jgi:hypothetical protein
MKGYVMNATIERPQELADALKASLAAERMTLCGKLHNHPLPITAPARCPEGLRTRLKTYAAAAAKFEGDLDALAESTAKLPLMMMNAEVPGAAIQKAGDELRRGRYDLVSRWLALIEERAPLLADTAAVLDRQVAAAEAALAGAREKSASDLKAIGQGPENDPRSAMYPAVAEHKFGHKVDAAPAVVAALAAGETLRAALSLVRTQEAAVNADTLVVGEVLTAAWKRLVGGL